MELNKDVLYPIGVVAKMLNISVATIRLYEAEGLILPQKSKGNHRSFTTNDIERIMCIRNMLTEKGLNLAGVRMMFSAIPCWDVKNCPKEDREQCAAYQDSVDPCWVSKNKDSVCASEDCSRCPVYIKFSNCSNMKEMLRKTSNLK